VVPIIEIISPMLGFQSIFLAVYYYGLALGKVKLIFLRELAYFVLRFPIFVWTVFTFGLMGAVYAATGLGFLRVALNLIVYAQASGRPFYEPLLRVRRSIGATMAMSAWFLLLRPFLTFIDGLPVLARLAIDCAMGAAIFSASLIVLWRMSGREAGAERAAIDFVLRRIGRPEPSTGA
jgi:PST family polysaccharide transporter